MSHCFQRRWVTFFAIVFVLTCYSEIVEGQQNWFKPAATTRRPIATAITSSKTKRFPEARKPAAVVFPEGTHLFKALIFNDTHVARVTQFQI